MVDDIVIADSNIYDKNKPRNITLGKGTGAEYRPWKYKRANKNSVIIGGTPTGKEMVDLSKKTFVHQTGIKQKHPHPSRTQTEYTSRVLSHESLHGALHKVAGLKASKQIDDVYARRGYHGIINHHTDFHVGERGPERVDITPIGESYFGGSSSKPKKAKSMKSFWWD